MTKDRDILYRVDNPTQLKQLSQCELIKYCDELRSYIIDECSTNPGHLSSSLGVVELSVALHYVYNTPHDSIVWDVGHQCYPHKIITERREKFHTKRCLGGISGFPKISESRYDNYGGGHASVSISAAYGIAKGAEMRGESIKSIAVIGDGSMTGGLAFEGLNNLGADQKADVLVILNDNHMSIDNATGALSKYLLRISMSRRYNITKQWLWQLMAHTPRVLELCRTVGRLVKRGVLKKSNLFESLNMRYFGPIDGHDLPKMIRVFEAMKNIEGPKLLHVMTTKGKGYEPAENNTRWHAPGCYNPDTGEIISAAKRDRFQDVFGKTLVELAQMDSRVVGITPAMVSGCSMNLLQESMPERCFDVGIAEGHAVTFAAGVAVGGLRPFCNIYSSFMQRAYDNIIHDVAIQDLPVTLCLDRGGLVGEDGATHHGAYDLAYLSTIPQLVVAAPRNELELRNMMFTALHSDRPFAIRYPRGCGEGVAWRDMPFESVEIGKGVQLREGATNAVAVVTVGATAAAAALAIDQIKDSEGVSIAHYDMCFAKPLDTEMLREIATKFERVVTVEDGSLRGGVGESIAAHINVEGYDCRVTTLGIPDRFINHGKPSELHEECGFSSDKIYEQLRSLLECQR